MKKIRSVSSLFLLALVMMLMQGCLKDTISITHISYEPLYKNKGEVLSGIKSSGPVQLVTTGKIALYGNYLLVNEVNKGVHIIDNSNPSSPRNVSFVSIPGNVDIAVRDNMLYADIYTDLVTIDISNVNNAVFKKVNFNIFPDRQYSGNFTADTSRYIVDWVKHETSVKDEIDNNRHFVDIGEWAGDSFLQSGGLSSSPTNSSSKSNSIGGAMARFTLVNDYLYTVGRSSLNVFNVSTASNPLMVNTLPLGWNIETIFPLNNTLFIGSQTGMMILNVDDPSQPFFEGNFSHACFGDPVIANDHYAFVTLTAMTDASECWGVAPQRNEMDIVDINNINQPFLMKVYDMEEPRGLSLDGNDLFVCDGRGGLKVYDAADVMNLRLLRTFSDIDPFDVITSNGIAIVVSKQGITQYDYSNINDVKKLSTISISQ